MATTANNSVGHSAGSVESPARVCYAAAPASHYSAQLTRFKKVRAEHFTNAHMNPEVSPGELPVSSGTAYSPMRGATLSNVLLPCSAAPAAADDGDDTAVVATRASSAALAQPDRSAAEILDSLRSLSGQKLGREADAYRPPMAPLIGEGRIQPTSLLLPQAITPRKESHCRDFSRGDG
ncbi:hypothetical protein Trco_003449 [Trichoderma cornu-damae]|uniref:Uncharacterized protein n=1 Tax=Trichoderma cornu-damae TaxID=654480 RepID=A0A9P8QIQ4_9HYPO|nr:hypothetical protein Trco_003449 [Trichoderma cornu-damae]